jgi:crotonobetainyl-CoA:carnitine CoA-transferase CaiB-like acyl-CoA transferase
MESPAGALHGIRVLDFSAFLPGPLASLLLAEAGADVVRIEPAGSGDPLRCYPPVLGPVGALYAMINRGKRCYGADLTDPVDYAGVLELAQTADIVVVQERPGAAERKGIGYEQLGLRNRGLIYCAITGYGSTGSHADRAGYDLAFLADSGLLEAGLSPEGVPVPPPTAWADIAGGTYPALINILLALRTRDRTGQGSYLEISMAHNMQPLAYRHFVNRQVHGVWGSPQQDLLGGGSARYNVYATADRRFVAVYALDDWSWDRLLAALGLTSALVGDGNDIDAVEVVRNRFVQRSASEWRELFRSKRVKATVVSRFAEAEAAGLVVADSSDRVRCGESEISALSSILDPSLRRPPQALEAPDLREMGELRRSRS